MSDERAVRIGDTVWYWDPDEDGGAYDGQPFAAIVTALSGDLANLCVFGRQGETRRRLAVCRWHGSEPQPRGMVVWQVRPDHG